MSIITIDLVGRDTEPLFIMSSRAWCFTLNNYTEESFGKLVGLESACKYIIYGRERASTGTPHLQGYVYFNDKIREARARTYLAGAHVEKAKGSVQQNIEYCSKEDPNPYIHGRAPITPAMKGTAEKDRWDAARAAAISGDLETVPSDIFLRFYRTLKTISTDYMQKPLDGESCCGVWLTGPSGCGKSRKARADYPDSYLKMANKWWDGYQQEETVILDDLDTKHECLGHHLKIWTDRYSFLAENKGGAIHIRPKTIIITSQYTIDDIWPDEETRMALKRRFKVVKMGGYDKIQQTAR